MGIVREWLAVHSGKDFVYCGNSYVGIVGAALWIL